MHALIVSLIFQWIYPKIEFPLVPRAHYPPIGRSMRAGTGDKAAAEAGRFSSVNASSFGADLHPSGGQKTRASASSTEALFSCPAQATPTSSTSDLLNKLSNKGRGAAESQHTDTDTDRKTGR